MQDLPGNLKLDAPWTLEGYRGMVLSKEEVTYSWRRLIPPLPTSHRPSHPTNQVASSSNGSDLESPPDVSETSMTVTLDNHIHYGDNSDYYLGSTTFRGGRNPESSRAIIAQYCMPGYSMDFSNQPDPAQQLARLRHEARSYEQLQAVDVVSRFLGLWEGAIADEDGQEPQLVYLLVLEDYGVSFEVMNFPLTLQTSRLIASAYDEFHRYAAHGGSNARSMNVAVGFRKEEAEEEEEGYDQEEVRKIFITDLSACVMRGENGFEDAVELDRFYLKCWLHEDVYAEEE